MAYAASLESPIEYDYEAVPKPKRDADRGGDDIRTNFGFGRPGGGIL